MFGQAERLGDNIRQRRGADCRKRGTVGLSHPSGPMVRKRGHGRPGRGSAAAGARMYTRCAHLHEGVLGDDAGRRDPIDHDVMTMPALAGRAGKRCRGRARPSSSDRPRRLRPWSHEFLLENVIPQPGRPYRGTRSGARFAAVARPSTRKFEEKREFSPTCRAIWLPMGGCLPYNPPAGTRAWRSCRGSGRVRIPSKVDWHQLIAASRPCLAARRATSRSRHRRTRRPSSASGCTRCPR